MINKFINEFILLQFNFSIINEIGVKNIYPKIDSLLMFSVALVFL